MQKINVVCAIIEHQNQILIGKKIEGDHPANLGGKWTLPGGKVEYAESLENALKREIREETNLEIEIKEKLGEDVYISKVEAKVNCFKCIPKNFNYKPGDDLQKIKWVDKQNLFKELDKEFIQTLPVEVIKIYE